MRQCLVIALACFSLPALAAPFTEVTTGPEGWFRLDGRSTDVGAPESGPLPQLSVVQAFELGKVTDAVLLRDVDGRGYRFLTVYATCIAIFGPFGTGDLQKVEQRDKEILATIGGQTFTYRHALVFDPQGLPIAAASGEPPTPGWKGCG